MARIWWRRKSARLWRPNFDRAEEFGRRRETLVEADKSVPAFRPRQMKCVREIQTASHPIQCFGGECGVLQGDARQPGKGAERLGKPGAGKSVDAAQYPFGLQENRCTHEHILAIDQRFRLHRLLRVVASQIMDD